MAKVMRGGESTLALVALTIETRMSALTMPAAAGPTRAASASAATRCDWATAVGPMADEVADVREDVQQRDTREREGDRARKGSLRIARFAGETRDVLPPLVRPEDADHCGAEAGRRGCRGWRRGEPGCRIAKHREKQPETREARDFDDRRVVLERDARRVPRTFTVAEHRDEATARCVRRCGDIGTSWPR